MKFHPTIYMVSSIPLRDSPVTNDIFTAMSCPTHTKSLYFDDSSSSICSYVHHYSLSLTLPRPGSQCSHYPQHLCHWYSHFHSSSCYYVSKALVALHHTHPAPAAFSKAKFMMQVCTSHMYSSFPQSHILSLGLMSLLNLVRKPSTLNGKAPYSF